MVGTLIKAYRAFASISDKLRRCLAKQSPHRRRVLFCEHSDNKPYKMKSEVSLLVLSLQNRTFARPPRLQAFSPSSFGRRQVRSPSSIYMFENSRRQQLPKELFWTSVTCHLKIAQRRIASLERVQHAKLCNSIPSSRTAPMRVGRSSRPAG